MTPLPNGDTAGGGMLYRKDVHATVPLSLPQSVQSLDAKKETLLDVRRNLLARDCEAELVQPEDAGVGGLPTFLSGPTSSIEEDDVGYDTAEADEAGAELASLGMSPAPSAGMCHAPACSRCCALCRGLCA